MPSSNSRKNKERYERKKKVDSMIKEQFNENNQKNIQLVKEISKLEHKEKVLDSYLKNHLCSFSDQTDGSFESQNMDPTRCVQNGEMKSQFQYSDNVDRHLCEQFGNHVRNLNPAFVPSQSEICELDTPVRFNHLLSASNIPQQSSTTIPHGHSCLELVSDVNLPDDFFPTNLPVSENVSFGFHSNNSLDHRKYIQFSVLDDADTDPFMSLDTPTAAFSSDVSSVY